MTLLVDRCPFYEKATQVASPWGAVLIRPYQIIVWVSVSVRGLFSPPFPAILDTGHSHNFSIKEEHLEFCVRLPPADLRTIGYARVNREPVVLKEAGLALHRNVARSRDDLGGESPYLLELSEGIAVHRLEDPFAPRLPLLGMRSLAKNGLRIIIDTRRLEVSVEQE